ncbi:hypothetical protein SAMN03159304_03123 [Pseudomonas sp. NFACC24-1]|uniref:hypothetical protein n=1 Tax=Pseudomonas sp. NFACC24-1 TaxID=1566189 RepID=UPI0008E04545|nr:hypothetical protein [Pseudomonas sp. NFACC24-1]SFO39897.1 hypothetical protein SAMN03159304_03123 [Pseudomonas sp. NFACC24-1]
MFILDTSVLRGISRSDLVSVCQRFDVAISTLTVLELASHLGDDSSGSGYLRMRGNFLKCKHPRILDDPFWSLASTTNLKPNPTRGEDRLILAQLIDAVEQSETLTELSSRKITYPDGQAVSCNDLGVRVSAILQDEEMRYVEGIESLGARTDGRLITANVLCEEILYVANKLVSPDDAESKGYAFLAMAPYIGYMLSRLSYYESLRASDDQIMRVDRNDCEDAYIALHLDFAKNNTLVTNDKGTIRALTEVRALLSEYLSVEIGQGYIMTGDEFKQYVASN